MLNSIIKYFLNTKLLSYILLLALLIWGISTAPFKWELGALPSDPVPVDAIPDIGENQQIVFSKWPGRSPQDIEDQISYPLTTYLLGIPGVKSVRSSSIFGFSNIYIIFSDEVEFYWSRSRILEKLNSLPADLLPDGVQPALGPDATALGQVFWYTLEGRDSAGNTTGGWDLHEIRSVQDYYLKYSLSSAEGVSEIASIGGFVKEYQVDVNPEALRAYNIPLHRVMRAVQESNRDVGAKTLEINQAEYLVRGLGYIEKVEDLEEAVVAVQNNVPIHIKDIAQVSLGPAGRRGLLDKDGAEVVGAVAVARFGANPLQVIQNLKSKIKEIAPGLPKKTLADGRESQLTIVPFYDRSELIYETLGTLEEALGLELLITLLVVIVMVYNLRASLLISSLLPIAVLMVFIAMKFFDISANIVALSGIAIAIGTMVDLGIILSENILKHLDEAPADQSLKDSIYKGASEVSSAILTAVLTTIVSFIPVFTMQAAEGKLFSPLAYTKTFALIAALLVSLLILPTLAQLFLGFRIRNKYLKASLFAALSLMGLIQLFLAPSWIPVLLMLFGLFGLIRFYLEVKKKRIPSFWAYLIAKADIVLALITVVGFLAKYWLPLGPGHSWTINFLFVALLLSAILGTFYLLETNYKTILNWCLNHKGSFLIIPALALIFGANIWLGFHRVFSPMSFGAEKLGLDISETAAWKKMDSWFPGIEKEFMPPLDEGSFLLMPTSMPHSGIAYNQKIVGQLDQLLSTIPEVEIAVGKLGRVESALDPAPISMFENIINYKPEYMLDEDGHRQAFKLDADGKYFTKSGESLSRKKFVPET